MIINDEFEKTSSLGSKPFGLLELGSNSLKFYLVGDFSKGRKKATVAPTNPKIKTHKFHWRVAHDFFLNKSLSDDTIQELINCLKQVAELSEGIPLSSMLAVATGVFREIVDIEALIKHVKEETGVRIRVIGGADEAKLMSRDFRNHSKDSSVFLFDLGGATMEWAWFEEGNSRGWGSLPLGAIRNEYSFRHLSSDHPKYLQESAFYCDHQLEKLPLKERVEIIGTGGTTKATAICCDNADFVIQDLRVLMERVLREGPPRHLKSARQTVFLPGLVILWRLLLRCKTTSMHYSTMSVRDGMAGRLVRLLGSYKREDLHATLLLDSTQLRIN